MSASYAIKDGLKSVTSAASTLTNRRSIPAMANDNLPQIISRAQAKELGLKRYFTGKPCRNGHVDARIVSSSCCVTCRRERARREANKTKEWRINNKERSSAQQKEYHQKNKEKRNAYAKKYYEDDKQRRFDNNADWKKRNPEKAKAGQKRYAQKNPEKLREKTRRWRKNNIEKCLEAGRISDLKRRSTIKGRINDRMSTRLYNVLRKGKNNTRWEEIVGYTCDNLKKHIEKQFTKGMNWERFLKAEIHIDHIIPLDSFTFESVEDESFKAAWSLTNLRPLWASENLKKSAKRIFLL